MDGAPVRAPVIVALRLRLRRFDTSSFALLDGRSDG